MSVNFDWQIDEDEQELGRKNKRGQPGKTWLRWLFLAMCTAILIVWGWGQWQIIREQQQTRLALQTVVDEQAAFWQIGAVAEFLAQAPPNAVWQADQFRSENINFWLGNPQITDFERQEGEIWANATWELPGGETRQRALFFEERPSGIVLRDSAYQFWGIPRREVTPWGTMRLYEADRVWRETFLTVLQEAAQSTCAADCPPLSVEISSRFAVKADVFIWPSPRLWGLDEQGNPPVAYWQGLRQAVTSYMAPADITFAVPAGQVNLYQELAAVYETESGRRVEIVSQDQWADPAEMVAQVDGAAITPTLEMIQSGSIQELTDLAYSDGDFDNADYYEQIWQGGFWRERMWMLPQSARLSLLYVDRELYRAFEQPLPTNTWTWDQLWADSEVFLDAGQVTWALATPNQDWLYSLAYNAGNRCVERVTINCSPRLRQQDVAAALEQFAIYHDQVPQYSGLSARDVAIAYQNEISLQTRRSAVWVDEPLQYEQNFLSRAARVLPYPGTGDFPGVTPLWVDGYIITSAADSPQAVWDWLTFLSYRYLVRTSRHIPARPSVAAAVGYWDGLPKPLADTMIAGFPYARPVLLAEREIFTDDLLDQVGEGQLSPTEAAAQCEWCIR